MCLRYLALLVEGLVRVSQCNKGERILGRESGNKQVTVSDNIYITVTT